MGPRCQPICHTGHLLIPAPTLMLSFEDWHPSLPTTTRGVGFHLWKRDYVYIYNAINCGLFFVLLFSSSPSFVSSRTTMSSRCQVERPERTRRETAGEESKGEGRQGARFEGKEDFRWMFLIPKTLRNAALVSGVGLCNIYIYTILVCFHYIGILKSKIRSQLKPNYWRLYDEAQIKTESYDMCKLEKTGRFVSEKRGTCVGVKLVNLQFLIWWVRNMSPTWSLTTRRSWKGIFRKGKDRLPTSNHHFSGASC